MAVKVIVATTSEIKKAAFDTSAIGAYLREIGVNYEFVCAPETYDDFAGVRFPQPFTVSGGMFAAMQRNSDVRKSICNNNECVIIAIENYVTDNAKDCVCIVVNYYEDGKKRELVSFSPAAYIASFPDKYLQQLAVIEKYQPGILGFKTTIGELIDVNMSKNWHKLFNPFDRVEQIRGTLDHVCDEFKKIVR